MTRLEEAAMKAYPFSEGKVVTTGFGSISFDQHHDEREAFIQGYEQAEKDLGWHSVKDSLPPMDEEVIVLTDDVYGTIVPGSQRICFGHRPNPDGLNGRNIDTGEATHYVPETYDGWNIPGITHWMYLPELKEEETH